MKIQILLTILTLVSSQIFAQVNTFGTETEEEAEYVFAIKLMPSLSGPLVQLAIKMPNSTNREDIQFLTVNSFARQLGGFEKSKANPNGENFIAKYNIFEVPEEAVNRGNSEIEFYTIKKTEVILNNLWRIKYSEYPYFNLEMNSEKGWAKHQDEKITWMPSDAQMNILRSYGINEISEFIEGDNAMRLLKDVRNRDWQNRYIQSGGVYQEGIVTDTIPGY
jgi:hypothetical protein